VTTTSALASIYSVEYGRLRRAIRRITGCREMADDALQNAYVKLHGREIDGRDVGLLVRTAQNLARDAMRADRVRAAYAAKVTSDQIASGGIAPDEAVAGRQELGALLDALKALPERTRRIFLLNKIDGMTYPQIARLLGVSVSTVEKEMISALEFCRAWRRRRDRI
jgi:RNA polymerase sigma factor (sigma-70 family)